MTSDSRFSDVRTQAKSGLTRLAKAGQSGLAGLRQRLNGAAAGEEGATQQPELPPLETPERAMVVMAHPDDAEFVCGGTVAKWCAEGAEVVYVVVTGGDKGTHDEEMHSEKLAAIREEEQRAACRALGVKACIFLGHPDGHTVDEEELRGQIVRLIRIHRPEVVVTWDAFRRGFNHRDHRNVGTLTADAVYPLVRDRLYYQRDEEDGLPSHEVNEVLLAGSDDPDHTIDVTDHWERRLEAVLCHASQIGNRTREDFMKVREEMIERQGHARAEERFRRWSIRRPQRPSDDEKKNEDENEDEDAEEAEAAKEPAVTA